MQILSERQQGTLICIVQYMYIKSADVHSKNKDLAK